MGIAALTQVYRLVDRDRGLIKLRVAPVSRVLVAASRRDELSTILRLFLTSNPFRKFANMGRIPQAVRRMRNPEPPPPREIRVLRGHYNEPFSACATGSALEVASQ